MPRCSLLTTDYWRLTDYRLLADPSPVGVGVDRAPAPAPHYARFAAASSEFLMP
jgi:hypothetical protein